MEPGIHSQNPSIPEMPFTPEALRYPLEKFHLAFSSGDFKGDVLIDVIIGPNIDHLNSALNNFRDIIVLKPTDHSNVVVKKETDSQTGGVDRSHASTIATERAGKSDKHEDKETGLMASIRHVEFDLNQENLTDPIVLPLADCLVFWCILETISKDFKDCVRNFKRFSKLLKPGKNLMFYGVLNCTFYVVGGKKFHVVKYNESDLRSMLSKEGFVITHLEVSKRKAETDLMDCDSVVFCTAYKEKKI